MMICKQHISGPYLLKTENVQHWNSRLSCKYKRKIYLGCNRDKIHGRSLSKRISYCYFQVVQNMYCSEPNPWVTKRLITLKKHCFQPLLARTYLFLLWFFNLFYFFQSAILKNKIQKKAGKYLLDAHSSITYRSDDKISVFLRKIRIIYTKTGLFSFLQSLQ